jgi:hypothetical protein
MRSTYLTLRVIVATTFAVAIGSVSSQPKPPSLDLAFFVRRVEPIFLEKRLSHTRCYVCHVESNNAFRLEKLAPGSGSWSDEQSRRNFEAVSILVNPGDPAMSRLLLHPLAPEAGGDVFHSGGRQFASKADPAWKTLAAWVNGAKLDAPGK